MAAIGRAEFRDGDFGLIYRRSHPRVACSFTLWGPRYEEHVQDIYRRLREKDFAMEKGM